MRVPHAFSQKYLPAPNMGMVQANFVKKARQIIVLSMGEEAFYFPGCKIMV